MGQDCSVWGNRWHGGAEGCSEGQGAWGGCPGAGEVTFVEMEVQAHSRQGQGGLYRTVFPLFCLSPRCLCLKPTLFLLK